MTKWKTTAYELPPEGVLVETLSAGGEQAQLKRHGALWFVKAGDTYVYYTPIYWKPIAGGST